MFKKLIGQADALKTKKENLEADWDESGSKALLEFYVKIIPMVMNAERCSIFIHDPITKEIWLKAGTGMQEKEILVEEGSGAVISDVITTGQHRIVRDLDKTNGLHKAVDEKTGFVTRDIISIPIKSVHGNEITGAVEVLNKKDGTAFTEEDRKLLEEMAHFLDVAIENIYFNIEATSLLWKVTRWLTIAGSALLWIIGLLIIAIIARVIWVGLQYLIT